MTLIFAAFSTCVLCKVVGSLSQAIKMKMLVGLLHAFSQHCKFAVCDSWSVVCPGQRNLKCHWWPSHIHSHNLVALCSIFRDLRHALGNELFNKFPRPC